MAGVGPATSAGDRHRLGRAGHPRRRTRGTRHHGHDLGGAGASWPASGSRGGYCRTASTCGCRTTARSPASTTRSSASRWSRRSAGTTGRPTSAPSTGCSRPAARSALQAITMPHDRMLATRDTYTWIVKYIFPGGHLPSVQAVHEQVGRDLAEDHRRAARSGQHYAETLKQWRRTFLDRSPEVAELGLRRGVPADVVALPGLLRGRLPPPATSTSAVRPGEAGGMSTAERLEALASSALGYVARFGSARGTDPKRARVMRPCCTSAPAEPCADSSGSRKSSASRRLMSRATSTPRARRSRGRAAGDMAPGPDARR